MTADDFILHIVFPREIVSELDRYIVGQNDAKRAVAIALRNRWRRQQLPEGMRDEVLPKNILMIGPTGVGKTEIARRLARLAQAPFIKVEATKFTEVGYVGRDVDSIIRDLIEIALTQTRERDCARTMCRRSKAAEARRRSGCSMRWWETTPSDRHPPEIPQETAAGGELDDKRDRDRGGRYRGWRPADVRRTGHAGRADGHDQHLGEVCWARPWAGAPRSRARS